jgi:hypothetical protein
MGGPRPPNGGIDLDPLIGLDDSTKPLRSKLLAVPELKAVYLDHVRTIAEEWLDWKKLRPMIEVHTKLIEKEVEADTRKLTTNGAFKKSIGTGVEGGGPGGPRPMMGIGAFAQQRRKYLLSYPEIKKIAKAQKP